MIKVKLFLLICINILFVSQIVFSADNSTFLNIELFVEPNVITIGEEGVLKIKVTPAKNIRISSSPEFVIRFNESETGVTFTKNFFTAAELEFKTKQDGNNVFLELEKDILIPFKIDSPGPGFHKISGKVVFTAVEKKDNWSVKTFQKFSINFRSKIKKRKRNKRKKIKS